MLDKTKNAQHWNVDKKIPYKMHRHNFSQSSSSLACVLQAKMMWTEKMKCIQKIYAKRQTTIKSNYFRFIHNMSGAC